MTVKRPAQIRMHDERSHVYLVTCSCQKLTEDFPQQPLAAKRRARAHVARTRTPHVAVVLNVTKLEVLARYETVTKYAGADPLF